MNELVRTTQAFPARGGGQDVFYPWSMVCPRPLILRAEGIYMHDDTGRDLIDFSSGPVVSNIGHGNVRVADAMAKQAKTVDFAYCSHARSQANIDVTERIAKLAGPGYERVCLTSGGSEAVECAVKFLRLKALVDGEPGRTKIITCYPSYHGGTFAALAMSGDDDIGPFLAGMIDVGERVPSPLTYRLPPNHTPETYARACAEALDAKIRALDPKTVLGFFIEPVGGLATGCNVPPASYFAAVRAICTKHGIPLVFDEILCGTGRTGRFLAAHNWPDAMPDMVIMAKGLGSGYTPLGATLIPARWADKMAETIGFSFFHTYSANPISCATALAVLDEYERLDVLANTRKQGAYLREGLEAMKARSPVIGDIRGMGLVMAMEFVTDKATMAKFPKEFPPADVIRLKGLDNGLLIYARRTASGRNGDWIMVSPPMTITKAEVDEVLKRLAATIAAFESEARRFGLVS